MNWMDNYFFIVFPYIAISVFLIATIYRYATAGYGLSSYSAQFLESKYRFWGIVPFHFGILLLFVWHLFVFLFPESIPLTAGIFLAIMGFTLLFSFGFTVLGILTLIISAVIFANPESIAYMIAVFLLLYSLTYFIKLIQESRDEAGINRVD